MKSNNEFKKLVFASFISQSGSHFFSLAISSYILASTGSLIRSSLIFVFSYLPSIFVSPWLGNWIDSNLSIKLLVSNDLIAAIMSIICGIIISTGHSIMLLCAALALRSIAMFTNRSGISRWIKEVSLPAEHTLRVKLFFLSFFLSTAISGMIAGLVLKSGSISLIVLIDVLTYLLGIGIVTNLKPLENSPPNLNQSKQPNNILMYLSVFGSMTRNRSILVSFLVVCISQALFQGGYSVLVSYLPIEHLKLGIGSVWMFQVSASFGILFAFLLNWMGPSYFRESDQNNYPKLILFSTVASIALLLLSVSNLSGVSLFLFSLMNLNYELIWLQHSSQYFSTAPQEQTAAYQFALTASASTLMAFFTLLYAWLFELYGIEKSILTMTLIALLLSSIPLLPLVKKELEGA